VTCVSNLSELHNQGTCGGSLNPTFKIVYMGKFYIYYLPMKVAMLQLGAVGIKVDTYRVNNVTCGGTR
jgi:hypothetical protein